MAQRGRGCLEIKDSSNPFFTTTNSAIGTSTKHLRTFDAPPVFRMMNKPDPEAEGIDWSFMYMKESDRIGAGVPASDSKLAVVAASVRESPGQRAKEKSMGKHPVMYEREEDTGVPLRDATCYELQPRVPADNDVREALLLTFKHAQKVETPLYSTANNEIGIKRPTAATFTFERRAQQQGFSNSFGGIHYRDMGLNTTITRSNVHDDLNHSFI